MLNQRINKWLDQRFPASDSVQLTQKRIYILPTRAGIGFLGVALAVLLLGINYQNNLAYAVCFLMISLFVTTILHTFSNLSGLHIKARAASPVFAGQAANVPVALESVRDQQQVSLGFLREIQTLTNLPVNSIVHMNINRSTRWRGWLDPGLLVISTVFPFGLLKAWSRVRLGQRILVYPQPVKGGDLQSLQAGVLDDQGSGRSDENLDALKNYEPGESISRIAWKVYAKGQGLHSLNFERESQDNIWLRWSLWPELSIESRLSRLAYWVVELNRQNLSFGLQLPDRCLELGFGDDHMHAALRSLALYQGGV